MLGEITMYRKTGYKIFILAASIINISCSSDKVRLSECEESIVDAVSQSIDHGVCKDYWEPYRISAWNAFVHQYRPEIIGSYEESAYMARINSNGNLNVLISRSFNVYDGIPVYSGNYRIVSCEFIDDDIICAAEFVAVPRGGHEFVD